MEKKKPHFNPLDITESLGYQTFRRDSRKPWSKEEDKQLHGLIHNNLLKVGFPLGIQELNDNEDLVNDVNWEEVSEALKTRKARDCRKRWVNSLNPNLKKGKWTSQEDEKLLESFKKYGSSWQKIAMEIPGRTEDQCAKRYIEVLDPNTKDRLRPWTIDEDLSLIKKVKTYGTKWRTISLEMESRPSLTCRNRWRKIVTDVVRGKANGEIKKEIDSIQGGLSKVEELSENFQTRKKNIVDSGLANSEDILSNFQNEPLQTSKSKHLQSQQIRYSPFPQALTSIDSPSYAGPTPHMNEDSPKPTSIDMDWKYTLKDTSGLTLSNGNINSDELAKQLIEKAKKFDLKISIHQHIHHHYGSANQSLGPKVQSPGDSSSNVSGNNTTGNEDLAYRYSHFNYLPPMAQPQLQSSNLISRENDLTRLLNPSSHQAQQQNSHQRFDGSNSKRRLSDDNNNHGSTHNKHRHLEDTLGYEELEDELDFWETMRSLSHFNTNNPIPGVSKSIKKKASTVDGNGNDSDNGNNVELYYGMEETVDTDLGFPGPVLPFNPS